MLAEKAASNAAEVEKAYGGGDGEVVVLSTSLFTNNITDFDDEIPNLPSSSRRQQKRSNDEEEEEQEEEYEDEEQLATVTVIEDFDPDTIIHGPARKLRARDEDGEEEGGGGREEGVRRDKGKGTLYSTSTSSSLLTPATANTKAKLKSKANAKVKYQTKAERAVEKRKQRARKTEKAERARGKVKKKGRTGGGKGKR